jgi:hypothetical protein
MSITEIDLTQIKAPVQLHAMTPEEAAVGYETVTMVFEKPVILIVGNWDGKVAYPIGTHEVPRAWKDHWYLKAHGAYIKTERVVVGKEKR